MDWHDSDPSEDEANHDSQAASRKRSSRACDQCRKTKSKCERGAADSTQCKSCAQAGTACTFLGPSYKRGPPKGYIHAIEQRWHQVESLLGALMQCNDPRVQSIVTDLRQDDLAREILGRVDSGPYGPSGRRNQRSGATKEDFFASVLRSNETSPARDPSRSRRQSRVSREKVSSAQGKPSQSVPVPTQEWQDNLATRLASGLASSSSSTPSIYGAPSGSSSSVDGTEPATQRRRLNAGSTETRVANPDWSRMANSDRSIIESEDRESLKDATEHMGQLSLDENQELRYHGKASGLHLLSRNSRTDDRNDGGVWKLPMARVWPPSKDHILHLIQEEDIDVQLPPSHIQDRLIELYFVYIHPVFPLIHKGRFLREYRALRQGESLQQDSPKPSETGSSPKPEATQKLSALLLLSMFAITARFSEQEMPLPTNGKMWEAGRNYQESAKNILTKIFHRSRPTTVQALLLLGYREFGIGSMEQGWIYIGMGIRMAIDLGLNRNSDHWKIHGEDMFSPEETQTRRQIWWVCTLADRYGSIYMGRPIIIRDDDFDTPLPEVNQADEQQPWRPLPSDSTSAAYPPTPNAVMHCFRATATLCVILGAIISKIYPVRATPGVSRRALLSSFESQLDQWYISLPEHLRYDTANRRKVPPPHILFLHIRYWGSVLLLNRAFIPNWKGGEFTSRHSTLELKAFDLAQGAASHIGSIVTVYRETFTLKRCSPFLTSYIFSAGIMHVLTLTLRPSNVQASLGLRQCMAALKDMEVVWPSASRAWDLLNGVQLTFDNAQTSEDSNSPGRHKRQADIAFAQEKSSDYLQREAFGDLNGPPQPEQAETGVQDLSTRIMAHMLGLDIPGIEPSTSFYPGYEWWPRNGQSQGSQPMSPVVAQGPTVDANPVTPSLNELDFGGGGSSRQGDEWLQSNVGAGGLPYPYNFNQYGL
ncbi:fungal-specific transcription factor domain-containing protein [Armillaria novae-zelandiae]|uniref:Fungal-specific transcription factor domain-containing protein n=1 Tax=Armillaria novae-zelandiae TaxID=153914 RepID=A0AA39UJL8_9AGAR|nr:fungal-specific transcription factor domain-containing protein [Armillaria novae-zelandiae]